MLDSSIEGYVQDKLELFRKSMERMLIEDLLEIAFKRLFVEKNEINSHHENDKQLHDTENVDDSVHAIPNKSFSFL